MKSKVVDKSRAALAAVGVAMLCWLVSCGGGTQVETYVPTRVLVFGDESSVIESDGRKYTVNAVADDGVTIDCAAHPLWVQSLASSYGLVFPQCPGTVVAPTSRIYAALGAKVADVATQVAAAGGTFAAKDLATVMVGANDVIALYQQYDGSNADALRAAAEAAGSALALQIASISQAGAKVLFATVIDVGQTPYGLAQEALGTGRTALLSSLTARFNARLRTGIEGAGIGGHQASQILADEQFRANIAAAAVTPLSQASPG